jgi:hypothetical protein
MAAAMCSLNSPSSRTSGRMAATATAHIGATPVPNAPWTGPGTDRSPARSKSSLGQGPPSAPCGVATGATAAFTSLSTVGPAAGATPCVAPSGGAAHGSTRCIRGLQATAHVARSSAPPAAPGIGAREVSGPVAGSTTTTPNPAALAAARERLRIPGPQTRGARGGGDGGAVSSLAASTGSGVAPFRGTATSGALGRKVRERRRADTLRQDKAAATAALELDAAVSMPSFLAAQQTLRVCVICVVPGLNAGKPFCSGASGSCEVQKPRGPRSKSAWPPWQSARNCVGWSATELRATVVGRRQRPPPPPHAPESRPRKPAGWSSGGGRKCPVRARPSDR